MAIPAFSSNSIHSPFTLNLQSILGLPVGDSTISP
jgi:hypothetical protein